MSEEELKIIRHSASHIMAEAIQTLFEEAKFGFGPAIDDGFYYDFELPRALTPDDLSTIEGKMKEIINADVPFIHEQIDKRQAQNIFKNQPYKL